MPDFWYLSSSTDIPLKQGLEQQFNSLSYSSNSCSTDIPLKQGLEPINNYIKLIMLKFYWYSIKTRIRTGKWYGMKPSLAGSTDIPLKQGLEQSWVT